MLNAKNKFYISVLSTCFIGYCWLILHLVQHKNDLTNFGICAVKNITGLPCPSCGSTRAILQLMDGNFLAAFLLNPIGIILSFLMVIIPIWMFLDLTLKENSLFVFYQKMETKIKKPVFAIPLIVLVLLNWGWNITKGL